MFSATKKDNQNFLFLLPMLYSLAAMYGVAQLLAGSNNSYLWRAHIGFGICFILLLIVTDLAKRVFYGFFSNYGGIFLFGFLLYYVFVAALYPDSDISRSHLSTEISKYIIPGLMMGIVSFGNITLKQFAWISCKKKRSHSLGKLFILAASVCGLVLFMKTTIIFLFVIPTDPQKLLLLPRYKAGYQSFSMYAIIITILSIYYIHSLFHRKNSGKLSYLFYSFIVLILCMVISFFCGIIGSKKEIFGSFLLWIGYSYFTMPRPFIFSKKFHITISGLFVLFFLCWVAALVFFVWAKKNFYLPPLRVFDYGKGVNVGSFFSRIDIIVKYGVDQLLYSPIFGDIGVEYKYGGKGMYMHSIISVQTHLGMIGSVLLVGYLVHRLYYLYRTTNYIVLKLAVTSILCIMIIACFFTWLPFWFLIGALLSPGFLKPSKELSFRQQAAFNAKQHVFLPHKA